MQENTKGKTGFVNVYNFVPFSGNRANKYDDKSGNTHTGVIYFTIETLTPLFIPNTSSAGPNESGHKNYDFYSYNDLSTESTLELQGKDRYKIYKPVIPGSEIRGMVRSIYETITNSCMCVLNADTRPVKRTGEVFKPGLIQRKIENGKVEYWLFPAKSRTYTELDFIEKDTKEGEFISEGQNEGYLIKGQKGLKKRYTHLFSIDKNEKKEDRKLSAKDMDGLSEVIKAYQEQPKKGESYKEYENQLESFKKGNGNEYFPVYFSILGQEENAKVYLSPACITKEISNNTIGLIAGEYNSCKNSDNCCPACDLFGMIGDNNDTAKASMVRFADAKTDYNVDRCYAAPVTLPELSSPKLGNTEFYLKRENNAKFWTYDYYFLDGRYDPNLYKPTLRGRKFYWNQPGVKSFSWLNIEKNERNMTVRPVKPGVVFRGKMYFDNISEKQLNQLMWILNCGSRKGDENDIVFKMGGAKPLGFGSVKLTIDSVVERRISLDDGEIRYRNEVLFQNEEGADKSSCVIQNYSETGFDEKCKASFMNLVSYDKMKKYDISYPMTKKQHDNHTKYKNGYEWFVNNHKVQSKREKGGFARSRSENYTKYVLPVAAGKNGEIGLLPYNEKEKRDNGSNDGKSGNSSKKKDNGNHRPPKNNSRKR